MIAQKDSVLLTTEKNPIQENCKALTCKCGRDKCKSIDRLRRERTPEGRYKKMKRALRLRITNKRHKLALLEREV